MPKPLSLSPLHSNAASPNATEQRPATADGRLTSQADDRHAPIGTPGGLLGRLPGRDSIDRARRAISGTFGEGRPNSMPAAGASTSTMELALLRRPSEASSTLSSAYSSGGESSQRASLRSQVTASHGAPSTIDPPRSSIDIRLETASQVSAGARSDIEAQHDVSSPSLRRASFGEYLGMQAVRHLIPVGAVATLSQGVVGYYMGKLFDANEDAALGVQLGLTAVSLVQQIASRRHTEANPDLATRAFLGESDDSHNHSPRKVWQEIQRMGALACELGAVTATILARDRLALAPLASQLAVAQAHGHVFPPLREFLSPIVNTGHVGHPDAPLPEHGKNLRPDDIGWKASVAYGMAVMIAELVAQIVILIGLDSRPASAAPLRSSVAAGAVEAAQAVTASAGEDTIADTAKEENLRGVDERHVRTIAFSSHSPFTREQLGRQHERVDTRKFNVLVPKMLAVTALYFMEPILNDKWTRLFAAAVVHAATKGTVLGADLSLTVRSYQMNDALRHRSAASSPSGRR